MKASRTIAAAALLACSMLVVSCSSGSGSDSSRRPTTTSVSAPDGKAKAMTVKMSDFAFKPDSIEVKVGDTVTFSNEDSAAHTAETDSGAPKAFDTGKLKGGATETITFDEAGDYKYHCGIHEYMTGTIRVLK